MRKPFSFPIEHSSASCFLLAPKSHDGAEDPELLEFPPSLTAHSPWSGAEHWVRHLLAEGK